MNELGHFSTQKHSIYQTPIPKSSKHMMTLDRSIDLDRVQTSKITLPHLSHSSNRTLPNVRKYDARQPRARHYSKAQDGSTQRTDEDIQRDTQTQIQVEKIVQANIHSEKTQTVFKYESSWSTNKVHLNLVTVPGGLNNKKYILVGNPAGKVDVIEHASNEVYKQLPIELMHCSIT